MTTPFGAEGDLTGARLGRGEYTPEDAILAEIDAATGDGDRVLNAMDPPPHFAMPGIFDVEVPGVRPSDEVRTGAVMPADTWPEDLLEDRIANLLREMGEDPDSKFPTLQVRRGPSSFTIDAANADPETKPQDNPMDPGGAV